MNLGKDQKITLFEDLNISMIFMAEIKQI